MSRSSHHKKEPAKGEIYIDPREKLKKFVFLRNYWHKVSHHNKKFIKIALSAYYKIHNKIVDRILLYLYQKNDKWWLPLGAGICAGLSQPPVYAFILLVPAFVVLIRLLDFSKNIKTTVKTAVLFNLGFALISLYWPGYGTYVSGFNPFVAFIFGICIIIMASIIPTVAIVIFGIIGIRVPMFRRVFLLASIWILAEYLRGFTIFNFPFAFVGYSVGFWAPMFQSASVWGVLGISFVLIVWSGSFYPVLFSQNKIQFIGIFRNFIVINLAFIFIVVAGLFRVYMAKIEYLPHKIALIQGNTKFEKHYDTVFETYQKLTYKLQEITNGELNIIVWPEGAGVPYNFEKEPLKVLSFATFINPGQTFIFNAIRIQNNEIYNTAYAYTMPNISLVQNADGTQTLQSQVMEGNRLMYRDKKYLVPYGEYIPVIGKLKIGKAIARGAGVGFTAGKIIDILETPHGKVLPLVCYEITYSGKIGVGNGFKSDYIVNITNDVWLGHTSGAFQHFVASKYRAVEEGLSVARVSNNGISAIIDPYGVPNSKKTKLFERDVIISLIPKKVPYSTLFDIAGNIITMLFTFSYTCYYIGVYFFYKYRVQIAQKITHHLEERDNKKKDPKYIKRY